MPGPAPARGISDSLPSHAALSHALDKLEPAAWTVMLAAAGDLDLLHLDACGRMVRGRVGEEQGVSKHDGP